MPWCPPAAMPNTQKNAMLDEQGLALSHGPIRAGVQALPVYTDTVEPLGHAAAAPPLSPSSDVATSHTDASERQSSEKLQQGTVPILPSAA